MKLDDLDLLNERNTMSSTRRDGFKWNNQMGFERQLNTVRDFLRKYPLRSILPVYQQAVQDRQFERSDLKSIQREMERFHWDEQAIAALN